MLSQDAVETVLGIEQSVATEPEEMAEGLRMTFYPMETQEASDEVVAFATEMREALASLGVDILDYEDTLRPLPASKVARWYTYGTLNTLTKPFRALFDGEGRNGFERPGLDVLRYVNTGKKVQRGTSIIALGEGEEGNLAVDHTMSFQDTTILTIVDKPEHIDEDSPFLEHFETAMQLFAHNMTNVIIGVDEDEWLVYNFNGSHPFYDRDEPLEDRLLTSLVPKIAAPIRPLRLEAFEVREQAFDPTGDDHGPYVQDLVESGSMLEDTGLYPPGKDLDALPWRNAFYRWAGKIHLDDRSGLSYGFLARQLPTELTNVVPLEDATDRFGQAVAQGGDHFVHDGRIHVLVDTPAGGFCLKVPDVWVMTLRSGSDKTNPDPKRDLVKLGLVDGEMIMETPEGLELEEDYRPSFDTRVILAHAVGNAIVGSMLAHLDPENTFSTRLAEGGMALGHWHGYVNPEHIREGWHVHGAHKPHVSCGTPQSGIYALEGKLEAFSRALDAGEPFLGDIHIEPQHGTNMTHFSVEELGAFLSQDEEVAGLGNRYLDAYKRRKQAASTPV